MEKWEEQQHEYRLCREHIRLVQYMRRKREGHSSCSRAGHDSAPYNEESDDEFKWRGGGSDSDEVDELFEQNFRTMPSALDPRRRDVGATRKKLLICTVYIRKNLQGR